MLPLYSCLARKEGKVNKIFIASRDDECMPTPTSTTFSHPHFSLMSLFIQYTFSTTKRILFFMHVLPRYLFKIQWSIKTQIYQLLNRNFLKDRLPIISRATVFLNSFYFNFNLISLFKATINLIFLSKEIKCCEATFIWQTVVRVINTTTTNAASYFTLQILYSYAQPLKLIWKVWVAKS